MQRTAKERSRPDEKGIETVPRGEYEKVTTLPWERSRPDEKGIETLASYCAREETLEGERSRPDEKGIETECVRCSLYEREGALPPR